MLEKPKHGWVDIIINGKKIGTASYIDYVPELIINSCLNYLNSVKNKEFNDDLNIEFDGEGYHFGIIKIGHEVYIYDDCGEYPHIRIIDCISDDVSPAVCIQNVLKETINDIKSNYDDWILWDVFSRDDYNWSKNRLDVCIKRAEDFLNE